MSDVGSAVSEDLSDLLGETLAGAYRLDEIIGSGGMGVVFGAVQLKLKRNVAVKILDPRFADARDRAKRFEREAESVARLDHRNCLQVFDYGTTEAGLHYMVMPRLSGRSLRAMVSEGCFSPRTAMQFAAQILGGLEHAHGTGVVHRDLKPANIFVVDDPAGGPLLKIVDFGIAKIVDSESDAEFKTRTGLLFGTPAYMSPEQAMGEPVDARCDLYALGIVLHRLITGLVPLRGGTAVDQMRKRATLDIPTLAAPCPAPVSRFVASLCERELPRRCPDAATARAQVEKLLAAAPEHDPAWDEASVTRSSFEPAGATQADDPLSVTPIDGPEPLTSSKLLAGDVARRGADPAHIVDHRGEHQTDAEAAPANPAASDQATSPDTGEPGPTSAPATVSDGGSGAARGGIAKWAIAALGASGVAAGLAAIIWLPANPEQTPEPPEPERVLNAAPDPAPVDHASADPVPTPQPAPATPPPDRLRQLNEVNQRDEASALAYTDRHRLLADLRSDGSAAALIDETTAAGMDLLQAGDSETPCQTFLDALDALPLPADDWTMEVLARASTPKSEDEIDAGVCSSAKRRLAVVRRTARPTRRAVAAGGGAANTPAPAKPSPKPAAGEIIQKFNELK